MADGPMNTDGGAGTAGAGGNGRRWLERHWPLLLGAGFGLYVLALLWHVFQAQSLLDASTDRFLQADIQRRAVAIADFAVERRIHAQELAASREISDYLLNRDLGMSLQYGLATNLDAIDRRFREQVERRQLRGGPLYRRIVFFDANGETLAQSAPGEALPVLPPGFGREPLLLVDVETQQLVTTAPVMHRGSYRGVVATIGDLQLLSRLLIADPAGERAGYRELLLTPAGIDIVADGDPAGHLPRPLGEVLSRMPENTLVKAEALDRDPAIAGMVLLRTAVAGLPLSMITLVPAEQARGQLASPRVLFSFGVIPFLLLAAAGLLERQRARQRALEVRYAESDRHRGELLGRNEALAGEIARREEVERALREKTTELELVAAELRTSMLEAKAASRAKSDFLAMVSHEIRTPMTGVLGMTELALDTALSDEQRSFLTQAQRSAEGLLTIINDILDFSRVESGKLAIEHVPFDLAATIADACAGLQLQAREKGLHLATEVAAEVPPALRGDPVRLRQILINLLGNAIKFTAQGSVSLGVRLVRTQGNDVLLAFNVRDTGIGIPPEKQQDIFEPFAQGDGGTTRRFGGTGLGLTIAARLTRLMRGEIRLDSAPGRGSEFFVTLPFERADAAALEAAAAPPPDAAAAVPPLDILVVEDNPVNQHLVKTLLERQGHTVRVADDGERGLAAWQAHRFDLVLMDIHMPVMDGLEATRRLRAAEAAGSLPHTPVFALTAAALPDERKLGFAAGVDGYLTKPLQRVELMAVLRTVGAARAGENSA